MTHHANQQGSDWAARAEELTTEAEIGLGWAQPAFDWLADLLPGQQVRQVVDVGAGPGVFSVALAQTFSDAQVLAADGEAALLERVAPLAATGGVGERVSTAIVDLATRLGTLPVADLLWISKVLHHLPDQDAALRMLRSRLRPAGLLAVVEGGLPMRYLPSDCGVGEPGLLSRLDAAATSAVQHVLAVDRGAAAPRPALDWPSQLATAGLTTVGTRTFLLDLPAPVPAAVRSRLVERLRREQRTLGDRLTPADAQAVDRLLDPAEPLGLHRRPDLFLLSAETVHVARR